MSEVPEGISRGHVEDVRKAIEHRATWFYLLMEEGKKKGLDWEDIARPAVFRCGCIHGEGKRSRCENPADLRDFQKAFATEASREVFEMRFVKATEDELEIHFHHCPLVAAWEKLGCSREDLALLCDIAMDGDRGIASKFDAFSFQLGHTIAQGFPTCILKFSKEL